MADEPEPGLEGRILGDEYVIVGALAGQGTSPSTYEGRHLRLGYRVAVRLTPRQMASSVSTEAEALARVRHPSVPMLFARGVFDAGTTAYEYLVREYAQGQPLSVVLKSHRRLDALRTVQIVRQILSAVGEAHDQGVVHGDLKPENIIIDDADGDRIRVIDFASATLDGIRYERRGTPRYLAPETANGAVATPRSDIYALGCILRELLVGEPLMGELKDVLRSVGGPRFVSSEAFADRLMLPPRLRTLIDGATATESHLRITSIREFAEALAGLDDPELATLYLGSFPPSTRSDQETLDLDATQHRLAPPSSYVPDLPDLRSVGRPTVWVMTGAPSVAQVTVQTALAQLAAEVEVRFLDEKTRAAMRIELLQHRIAPPWVLIFGDLHALLGDPLLGDLAGEGETARLLISSHANLELTQTTINTVGLDWQICLPSGVNDVMTAVQKMVERSARRRRYCDGLRISVVDAVEQREELSRRAELEGMH